MMSSIPPATLQASDQRWEHYVAQLQKLPAPDRRMWSDQGWELWHQILEDMARTPELPVSVQRKILRVVPSIYLTPAINKFAILEACLEHDNMTVFQNLVRHSAYAFVQRNSSGVFRFFRACVDRWNPYANLMAAAPELNAQLTVTVRKAILRRSPLADWALSEPTLGYDPLDVAVALAQRDGPTAALQWMAHFREAWTQSRHLQKDEMEIRFHCAPDSALWSSYFWGHFAITDPDTAIINLDGRTRQELKMMALMAIQQRNAQIVNALCECRMPILEEILNGDTVADDVRSWAQQVILMQETASSVSSLRDRARL